MQLAGFVLADSGHGETPLPPLSLMRIAEHSGATCVVHVCHVCHASSIMHTMLTILDVLFHMCVCIALLHVS